MRAKMEVEVDISDAQAQLLFWQQLEKLTFSYVIAGDRVVQYVYDGINRTGIDKGSVDDPKLSVQVAAIRLLAALGKR